MNINIADFIKNPEEKQDSKELSKTDQISYLTWMAACAEGAGDAYIDNRLTKKAMEAISHDIVELVERRFGKKVADTFVGVLFFKRLTTILKEPNGEKANEKETTGGLN